MNTQVVLITGGLTGIGRATALTFAKEGAQVVVSGRRDEDGKKLVAELRKLGAEAEFVRSDVRHEEDVRSLVDKTVARFGRLDAAVNCAGTEGTPGPVTEQTAETYAATFETNVLGTLLSMKHELRVMLAQGSGSIVNVSSTYGHTGAAGASVYSASKHAVEGLTKSAALEVAASGVRVKHGRPGSNRDWDAEPLYRHRRKKGRPGIDGAAQTRRETRRDRADHRLSLFRQGVIHHGRVLPR
jgi:NAD(P)-dependent dehydrogenase (short-subunit alcohol dehydrogenase family)